MPKNLFIVFDGLDGSGKGEMTKRLNDYLKQKNSKINILLTREPTEGKYGKEIRQILQTEKDPKKSAEKCLALFVKDRYEHLEKEILPFLKNKNSVVICDRYYYSTIAFQHTQGLDIENIICLNICFRTPDIAFILDLPAETAIERINKRGSKKEKFEQLQFMKELRQNFLDLTKELGDNIKIIDASKSKDDVFAQIKKAMDKLF